MRKSPLLILSVAAGPFLTGTAAYAQTAEVCDTLVSSIVTGEKTRAREAGTRIIQAADFRRMVSATGDADIIKYIQTLPGVSTGGEGSSAYYVRGGNIGSNLITLDGVPIYGSSHLLGFTAVYPADIVSDAQFQVGGFTSEEGNLTSSHIKLTTADGDFSHASAQAFASNFLFGGSASLPIVKKKLSLTTSLRFSPVGLEFQALKPLTSALDSIGKPKAIVYDAFAKLKWRIDRKHSLYLTGFNSADIYSYDYGSTSEEHFQWSNIIAKLGYDYNTDSRWHINAGISYNRFANAQGMVKKLGQTDNNLAIRSFIREFDASAGANYDTDIFHFQSGVRFRYAQFNPATSMRISGGSIFMQKDSPATDHITNSSTATGHAQVELKKEDRYTVRAAGRLNFNRTDRTEADAVSARFYPEAGLLARVNVSKSFGFEATADYTRQLYHTLEGIPLGWSLDLIVPSDEQFGPERATQYYAGVFANAGNHRFSIGCYTKKMSGLVYFIDATSLFSSAAAGWRDKIDVGTGTSEGCEFLYEKTGKVFSARLAYTYSDTDRTFPETNGGKTFPAKFDRRHILNVSADYILSGNGKREWSVNALFTYQSGHYETVPSGYYPSGLFRGDDEVGLRYYSGINNFHMPAYVRADMGCTLRYNLTGRHPRTLNLGIYNLLNRHNPFKLTYDANDRSWKKISIFPIMPSIKWTIAL